MPDLPGCIATGPTREEVERLLAALHTAVRHARAAGEAAVADEDIADVRLHLVAALAALADANQLLAPPRS